MKKIKIYSGITVNCKDEHPVLEVKRAINFINYMLNENINELEFKSNSSDFISAMRELCKNSNIEFEIFLDGISCGNDTEPYFKQINEALDMIHVIYLDGLKNEK